MLPKEQRISKAQARDIFIHGAHFPTRFFILKLQKSPNPTPSSAPTGSRFAVSVSKKIAPTAVLRNRTRRRVYSALRSFIPNIAPGFLVAFVVKKGGETLSVAEIQKEIQQNLVAARLIEKK